MNQIFYDAIMENPVIAAVKDEDGAGSEISTDPWSESHIESDL